MTAFRHRNAGAICCRMGRSLAGSLKLALLSAVGLMLALSAARGGALSFVSTPADAQLDGDPIRDIEVAPGDRVEYFVTLSTIGLGGAIGLTPVVNFSYKMIYDPSELRLNNALVNGTKLDILDDPVTMPGGLFPGGDALLEVVAGNVGITHVGGNIAANTVRPLDLMVFTVLTPVNDGLPDFSFADVLINGAAPAAGVFTFDQVNEVQPRPVPEPATLLILAGGLLCLIAALRWPRRARVIETIQPLLRPLTRRRYRG
jgi:hypothetical protein